MIKKVDLENATAGISSWHLAHLIISIKIKLRVSP